MGRGARMRPARLAGKFLQIRKALGETQDGMANKLGFQDVTREYISGFERGTREPPLPVILRMANMAGVYVDALIDDELDLPDNIPANPKSVGIRKRAKQQKRSRA